MSSTTLKDGKLISRIVPSIKTFSAVTCPRTFAPTIVIEYGKAQLTGKSMFRRAEMLIELAHPDFREDLIKAAQVQNIWTRSNKI